MEEELCENMHRKRCAGTNYAGDWLGLPAATLCFLVSQEALPCVKTSIRFHPLIKSGSKTYFMEKKVDCNEF